MTIILKGFSRRFRFLALPAGILLLAPFFFAAQRWENASLHLIFDDFSSSRAYALQKELDVNLEVIRALSNYYAGSENVTRDEFKLFVLRAIKNHPEILAVEWLPKVTVTDREAFEQGVAKEIGRPYRIFEFDGGLDRIDAGQRPEYYPIAYVEPFENNEAAFGYDHASVPSRWEAMEKARDTGEAAVTQPFDLFRVPRNEKERHGVLIFSPVYGDPGVSTLEARRKNLTGFICMVIRFSDLVEFALADIQPAGVHFAIFDDLAPENERLLYHHGSRLEKADMPAQYLSGSMGMPFEWRKQFSWLNRRWTFVAHPARAFLRRHFQWEPWIVMGGAFFISLTLIIFLFVLARNNAALKNEIRERRAAENRRKDLEKQLIQAQKMESIGSLAGGVAHDFNNILTVINGYAAMQLETLALDDPRYESLREIHLAGQRAASLTKQLLAFSRQQIIEPKVVRLDELVIQMEKMLRRLIGENIELHVKTAPDLQSVKADPGQIEQVLLNMAVNARDAMPDGGKLIIETSNDFLDERTVLKRFQVKSGDYVVLSISDTGQGMSEAVKERIFEPFFTTKEVGKGTGLGLATCFGIVKQAGGHIQVYSELGTGTTFKVYLPSFKGDGESASRKEPETRHLLKGSEKVLVVEDDPMIRQFAVKILRENGYQVLLAENGEEALHVLGAEKDVALVVTDVIMPKMGGKRLIEQAKLLQKPPKFLFTSGYTDSFVQLNDVMKSDSAFLQKPYSPKDLLLKIRAILDT